MINQRTSLEIAGEDRSIESTLSGVQKQLNTKPIGNEDNNDILWKEKCDELSKRGDTRREGQYKKTLALILLQKSDINHHTGMPNYIYGYFVTKIVTQLIQKKNQMLYTNLEEDEEPLLLMMMYIN